MKKIIFGLIFSSLLFTCLAFPKAFAAEISHDVDLYISEDYNNCVLFVNWENTKEKASVSIEDPDGKKISVTSNNSVTLNGGVKVNVGKAKSGWWIVHVKGNNIGSVTVSGGNEADFDSENNPIKEFTAELLDDSVKFSWDITSSESEAVINIYTLYNNDYNYNIVYELSCKKKDSIEVPLSDIQITGYNNFVITSYINGSNYEKRTQEPINIVSSTAPEKLSNIKVGSINGTLYATWDNNSYGCYQVTVYDYDTLDPLYNETVYQNYWHLTGADYKRAKIAIATVDEDYQLGLFDLYDINIKEPEGYVKFTDEKIIRDSNTKAEIVCSPDETGGFYVDSELVLENAEAGQYDVSLTPGPHEIIAFVKDKYGNTKTFTKNITVDNISPELNLNVDNNITTNADSIIINGSSEPGALVTINGVEQNMVSGNFSAKVDLAKGSNYVTVISYDAAGNKSVKTVHITTEDSHIDLKYIIIPSVFVLLLCGLYFFINLKAWRAKNNEKKS